MRSGSLGGLLFAGRMILLPVAQDSMTVAADRQCFIAMSAACDVMELKDQRFVDTAEGASGRVRTQSLQGPLLATLTLQFLIVHVQNP